MKKLLVVSLFAIGVFLFTQSTPKADLEDYVHLSVNLSFGYPYGHGSFGHHGYGHYHGRAYEGT